LLNSRFTRDALKPHQPRGMGKGLSLAVLVHVGLIIAIAIGVSWRSRTPDAVEAELWAAVPQTAAPRAVEPEPAPPPPAPPPKPAPKVEEAPPPPKPAPTPDPQIAIEKAREEKEKARKLEEEQQQREREKQEALRKEEARKEEAQRREAQRKQEEAQKRKEELEAKKREQQQLAQLEAIRKANLERMMGQAAATGDPRSTGTAQQSAGPSASYAGRIKAAIKPKIVYADEPTGNPTAEVEVRAGPDGTILGRRLIKSSNVKEWDDAVLRAIDRTEVLPRDVDGRVPSSLVISFRPRD
jgi:colicin import membrane protein